MSLISIVLFLLLKRCQCFNNYEPFIFDISVIYWKFQTYQAKVDSWCNEVNVAAILEPPFMSNFNLVIISLKVLKMIQKLSKSQDWMLK